MTINNIILGSRAFGLAHQQVSFFGREIQAVPPNDNHMFEAISRQLEPLRCTAQQLRAYLFHRGYANVNKYRRLHSKFGGREGFLNQLLLLQTNGFWTARCESLVIEILSNELATKIVVVQKDLRPVHYPHDNIEVRDEDIVLVKDHNSESHFDATSKREDENGGKYSTFYDFTNSILRLSSHC